MAWGHGQGHFNHHMSLDPVLQFQGHEARQRHNVSPIKLYRGHLKDIGSPGLRKVKNRLKQRHELGNMRRSLRGDSKCS